MDTRFKTVILEFGDPQELNELNGKSVSGIRRPNSLTELKELNWNRIQFI